MTKDELKKEAEEYVMRDEVITENDRVPFDNGYGFQTVSFENEVKKAFIDGYHECKKEHEWHDLRKDPNDLPNKEKLGQTFVVAFAFNEQTQQYYSFDCAEYIDKERFITHTINGSNENNGYKVIAWKEIE